MIHLSIPFCSLKNKMLKKLSFLYKIITFAYNIMFLCMAGYVYIILVYMMFDAGSLLYY